MWDIKLKATNEQTRKTNKNSQAHLFTILVIHAKSTWDESQG